MRGNNLSDFERRAITERIRSVRRRHQDAGISGQTMIFCSSCRKVKPLLGAVSYSHFRLCNDCALHFELAKAVGDIKSIEDFILPR